MSDSDSDRHTRSRTYRNTATTVLCCRGCCSDDCISGASHALLMTDTKGEALQLPLSHICITYCAFTIRFLSECSGGNFAPAAYHYASVTNGHGVCPIVIPCFHVPEVYG